MDCIPQHIAEIDTEPYLMPAPAAPALPLYASPDPKRFPRTSALLATWLHPRFAMSGVRGTVESDAESDARVIAEGYTEPSGFIGPCRADRYVDVLGGDQ